MIHPNDKFRFISKERLLFISHNNKREILGVNATVEELIPLCGKEVTVTMYDDSDGTIKCNEIPEYWLPSYLLEEIQNDSQFHSVPSNQGSNNKIKRHK